jgi:hypothetical protein
MRTSKKPKNAQAQAKYDSMGAAAAALGVKVADLKKAKRLGAPGFHNSRVDISELRPWLDKRRAKLQEEGNSKEALEIRKLLGQCERIEYQNEVERGRFYEKESVHSEFRRIGEILKTMLVSKCRNELAVKLEGLDIYQRMKVLDEFALEVLDNWRSALLEAKGNNHD